MEHASQNVVRINGNAEWKIQKTQSGLYVGICDPLGLTVQADTWAEMMEVINDAMEMLFSDLIETKEFEQFLSERGWVADGPREIDSKFDLPFHTELVGA